ncbi:EpsG family protein [Vibrio breoganii]
MIFITFEALGLPKESLAIFVSFSLNYSVYKLYKESCVPENNSFLYLLIGLLITYLSFNLLTLVSGIRFALALSFFLLGYFSRSKFGLMLLFFSPLVHYSFVIVVVLFIISRKSYYIDFGRFFIPAAMLGLFSSELSQFLLPLIGHLHAFGIDVSVYDKYLTGQWGVSYVETLSAIGKLIFYFERFLFLSLVFVYRKYAKEHKDHFLDLLIIFLLAFINFPTISRFTFLFYLMSSSIFLARFKAGRITDKYVLSFIVIILIKYTLYFLTVYKYIRFI